MDEFLKNLKTQAEENPVLALGVIAAVFTGAAKLIDAHGHHVGSRAYAADVARRVAESRK